MAGGLTYRLASVVFGVALEKYLVDVLGILFRNLEQLVLAGSQVVGDGGLVEVAHVVELMTVYDKSIRFVAHHVFVRTYLGRVRGVEVSIRLLGGFDHLHDPVELSFQLGVVLQLGQVSRSFHNLVQVGINETVGAVPLYFLAREKIGGRLQVRDSRLGLLESEWYQDLALSDKARTPKLAGHLDFVKGYRFDWLLGLQEKRKEQRKNSWASDEFHN